MMLKLYERAGLIGPDVYLEIARELGAENARRVAEELRDKKQPPPKKGEKT